MYRFQHSSKGVKGFVKLIVKLTGVCVFFSLAAQGADIQWSGRYRAEGNFYKNLTLDRNANLEDSYIVHHLILSPKIIATDGLNIYSRFDIFNNALANNQTGQVFGNYTGQNPSVAQNSPPGVLTHAQQSETILATELYMNWINEFGALVVGRVPFHFGLGMVYHDGRGNFDHFLSTKDIVGYRLALGNISIMPAYGKVKEGYLNNEDDINDYLVVVDYSNPETDISMGFMFDSRVAPTDGNSPTYGNDTPASYFATLNSNFVNPQIYDGFNAYNMNFYVKKKSDNFNLGAELGFLTGYTGIKYASGDRVELSGFGLAAELGYRTGNLLLNLKTGLASGDDPDTARFEGYFFSPNYHVAMMMFNYPMGQYDVLKSTLAGTRATTGTAASLSGLDTEVVSNAIYFAPNLEWTVGERYDLLANFCYAILHKPPVPTSTAAGGGSVGTSLGFESDLGFRYHLTDKFTWETQIGLFFPGTAWAGTPSNSYKTDFAYGATTKAAINF